MRYMASSVLSVIALMLAIAGLAFDLTLVSAVALTLAVISLIMLEHAWEWSQYHEDE